MSWMIVLAAVDGTDDFILFIRTDSQTAKRLTGATVGADEGFVVLSGQCRASRVVLTALGANALDQYSLFHSITSTSL